MIWADDLGLDVPKFLQKSTSCSFNMTGTLEFKLISTNIFSTEIWGYNKESLLLLLKTAAQAQVGKIKVFINCFRNPTSSLVTENWRKHNSGKQPTVDCSLEPDHCSGVKHSIGKVKVKVKSSMARSHPVENLLPQNVGSIINYLQ